MANSFAVRPAAAFALATLAVSITAQQMRYPETRKSDQVDTYLGVRVADPYRWLEDETSAETARWVEAENKVTFAYLDAIPFRARVKERLTKLYNYPRYGGALPPRRLLLLLEERRPAESIRHLHAEGARRRRPRSCSTRTPFSAEGTTRSRPWRCRRPPVRRLLQVHGRIGLARLLRHGRREPEDAVRRTEMGQGLRHRLEE